VRQKQVVLQTATTVVHLGFFATGVRLDNRLIGINAINAQVAVLVVLIQERAVLVMAANN